MSGAPYRTTCGLCQQPFSAMTEARLVSEFAAHLRQKHQLRVDGTPLTEAEQARLTDAFGPAKPLGGDRD
jgi:hypothetical protein